MPSFQAVFVGIERCCVEVDAGCAIVLKLTVQGLVAAGFQVLGFYAGSSLVICFSVFLKSEVSLLRKVVLGIMRLHITA